MPAPSPAFKTAQRAVRDLFRDTSEVFPTFAAHAYSVCTATELPFAAFATPGTTDGGNAQKLSIQNFEKSENNVAIISCIWGFERWLARVRRHMTTTDFLSVATSNESTSSQRLKVVLQS